jgi:dienelactone hydrolase
MAERNLDLQRWIEYLYQRRPRRLGFSPRRANDLAAWQRQVRAALIEAMGGWPEEPVPLEPEITEAHDDGAWLRQRLLINSEAMMTVPCWLLVPKDLRAGERRPAVLALHGHGNGKDDVVGLDHGDEGRRQHIAAANYDYARQFAQRGYIVLAPDHRNFGERRYHSERLGGRDPCNVMMLKAALFGRNLLLCNLWDACKCLDYLQTRPDVDPARLGVVGLSYGGTLALWVAAFDERVAVACVSCYLNSFAAYALELDNFCGVQTPTGFFQYLDEMWELGVLVAPRPLLIEAGLHDQGFPIDATREQYHHLERAYQLLGVADRLALDVFEGGHQFSGRRAFEWFARWLEWRA